MTNQSSDSFSSSPYSAPSEAARKRIQEVLTALESHQHNGSNGRSSPSESELLADQLLHRSPSEFLLARKADELVAIVHALAPVMTAVAKSSAPLVVETEVGPSALRIRIAMRDCPFIVNTVTEVLRASPSRIHVLLHPIVSLPEGAISITYAEIDPVSAEQATHLENQLRTALAELLLTTGDFSPIIQHLMTLGSELRTLPERCEEADFVEWLIAGGFVFIGFATWEFQGASKKGSNLASTPHLALGCFKAASSIAQSVTAEMTKTVAQLSSSDCTLVFTKLTSLSVVHRHTRLQGITFVERDASSVPLRAHTLVGLLTSHARSQETFLIPLVRGKQRTLFERLEVLPNSYDYKNIANLLDNMPKDVALRLPVESLAHVAEQLLSFHKRNATHVVVVPDPSADGAVIAVMMPRDRFNTSVRKKIQEHVDTLFGSTSNSSEYHLDVSDKSFARIYLSVVAPQERIATLNAPQLEQEIADLSRSWRDNLEERMRDASEILNKTAPLTEIAERYLEAFPEEYQSLHSADAAIHDIQQLEALHGDSLRISRSRSHTASPECFILIVYNVGSELTISRAFPILDNAGLEVMSESACRIQPRNRPAVFVHRFMVRARNGSLVDDAVFLKFVAPGLTDVFVHRAVNDPLNQLLTIGPLSGTAISLLRTYSSHLAQINKFATRHAIFHALAAVPAAASQLWNMFEIRFNPDLSASIESRQTRFSAMLESYREILRGVSDITQDRILRGLVTLLQHTVRTNFYAQPAGIAIKVQSELVDVMPAPRPKFEIFVSSPIVEGVHLRSAMIARGGLRWSDRKDDYRTEVLGLMKTQRVKNVVIVPSGAKGGFIVKNLPEDPAKVKPAVEAAYREFIRSLLSLADNRVDDKVVSPPNMVVYDGPDPYFVVAADKGTATFSDIANEIAQNEYHFWLDDAFASGGSNGYDHKLYGITAKGAWVCVERHFLELGIDYQNTPFSVVGIGDMSGDVFGNGLLLSNKIKLIAAFDHRAIFIDPAPDPTRSFQERKRLFETKGTQWSDYDRSLISAGGGVISRAEKEIRLSAQARAALGIADDAPESMSAEQVISCILKAPADLLWNGGIGTYVKSELESHSDVADSTNDGVRVNATELRVRVVGEGGNLGFTQRGRIEFARRGGRINTDAIDNSAGVDLSDHEVNIKILLSDPLKKGTLTSERRRKLLREVAGEVCDSVLQHNYDQALTLSLAVPRSKRNIEYYSSLLRELSRRGYISRSLDALPDEHQLSERALRKEGLARPELAACLAAVKMWSKNEVLDSGLADDSSFESIVTTYFPSLFRTEFGSAILNHPLRRDIIATEVVNSLHNGVGISFIHRMCLTHSVSPRIALRCTLAAMAVLSAPEHRASMRGYDTLSGNGTYMELLQTLNRMLRAAASWMMSTHREASLQELIQKYLPPFQMLAKGAEELMVGDELRTYQKGRDTYTSRGISTELASSLALAPLIVPALEMLWTAHESNCDLPQVVRVFSVLIRELGVGQFVTLGQPVDTLSRWDNDLRVSSYDEIRRGLSTIACRLLRQKCVEKSQISATLRSSPSFEALQSTLSEINSSAMSAAMLAVVARLVRGFEPTA